MSDLCLIFSADDYGRSLSVNDAVAEACRAGLLTSASLMVTGSAVDDAVARAAEGPGLAIGLHLTVTGGRSAQQVQAAPHLLDRDGRLRRGPARFGVACFLSRQVRAEVRREVAAQCELFAATGLAPSHIDGHCLLHLHPTLLAILLPLAQEYGFHGTRLVRDDLWLTLGQDRRDPAVKVGWASVYALLWRMAGRRLRESGLAVTDRVYGLLQSGRMHEGFVAELVRRIPARVRSAELYFHPSTEAAQEPYGPNPGDLAALLSPRVRQAVEARRAELTDYRRLALSSHRRIACPGH